MKKTIEYFDDKTRLIGELMVGNQEKKGQPAIIVFPAFEGRDAFYLNYANKLADNGYITFLADMYGDAEVGTTLEDCFRLISPFLDDRKLVRKRALLAYDTLLKNEYVNPQKVGAVGFCFGGMCVLEIARSGSNLCAGVSMHGVLAKSSLTTHPIKTKLLILQGYQDPQVPPEELQHFAQEMFKAGVNDWIFTFFGDAKHSFTDIKAGTFDAKKEQEMGRVYNKVVAEQSFRYADDFFSEQLGLVNKSRE